MKLAIIVIDKLSGGNMLQYLVSLELWQDIYLELCTCNSNYFYVKLSQMPFICTYETL